MENFIKTIDGLWINPRYIVYMGLNKEKKSYFIVVISARPQGQPDVYYIEHDEAAKLKSE